MKLPISADSVSYHPGRDLFEPKEGISALDLTRLGHPLSVTLRRAPDGPGGFPLDRLSPLGIASGDSTWSMLIKTLSAWRVIRFHLADVEAMSAVELRAIQEGVREARGHVVLSVGEALMAPNIEIPVPSRIHVTISYDSPPERFDFLASLVAAGHATRALTLLSPDFREILPALREKLAICGIEEWTISSPFGPEERHWLPDSLELSIPEPPFITSLKKNFSWMRIEYACFPLREGSLIAQSDGALFTTNPVTAKRSFLGWLTRMGLPDLMTHQTFDPTLHGRCWLEIPEEKTSGDEEDLLPDSVADDPLPYDAFVSYDNGDWPEVRELVSQLKEAGARLWVDKLELPPGSRWITVIEEIIKKIPVMLVIIGKTGTVGSGNQKLEVDAFQQDLNTRVRRLIPIILSSAPNKVELPSSLETYSRVEMTQTDPDPLDQILWGITGKKPSRR